MAEQNNEHIELPPTDPAVAQAAEVYLRARRRRWPSMGVMCLVMVAGIRLLWASASTPVEVIMMLASVLFIMVGSLYYGTVYARRTVAAQWLVTVAAITHTPGPSQFGSFSAWATALTASAEGGPAEQ